MNANKTRSDILSKNFDDILNCSKWSKGILKIQDCFIKSTFEFFKLKDIASVCLPVTTNSVTSPMGLGSDSLPVKVNLFGIDTYLADSMQFHLEYLLRLSEEKGVHYIMPTFRGEETDYRHLSQFYHSEAEIEGNLKDVITLVTEYVIFLSKKMLENCADYIREMAGNLDHIESIVNVTEFPQVTFKEAKNLLKDVSGSFVYNQENDFYNITHIGEKKLIEIFEGPVWLLHYPFKSIPFYQKRIFGTNYAYNADLLMGIGETVGCGERCTSKQEVITSMKSLNVNQSEYDWYIKMKEKRPMETAGFGMGTERFILWLINHNDIRDVQLIMRDNGKSLVP